MDYTITHNRFGRSHLHPMVQLTNTRRSDGAPDPDTALKDVVRIKIRHYRNLYLNHPDPIPFIPYPWTLLDGCMMNLYLNHPDPIPFIPYPWTLLDGCMMNLFVRYFCTLTVKHRLCLMNCQRNRTSFSSFALRVSLI
jgi:hypothetical protein